MPMYSFICPSCQYETEVIRPMSESDDLVICAWCSSDMQRNFKADLFHTESGRYDKPIVSDAMAVSIDQIAEHKRAFPDVQITDQGQPVMESYSQHKAYMEKSGFVKFPSKRKRIYKKVVTNK